jgi:membrane associated rhomboid family serine protease
VIPLKDNIPTDRAPIVTLGLIAVNVVVYVLTLSNGSLFGGPGAPEVIKYGAIPHALVHGSAPAHALDPWATVFTSMFVHGSLLMLAVNMLFLWIFGNTIEDAMGRVKYLLFYVLGGIAALALMVVLEPNSEAPIVGAQGAVAAVLGGYVVLYGSARVLAFSLIPFWATAVEVPIVVMVVAWFIVQAVFGFTDVTTPTGDGGIVGDIASLGGFLFGLATVKLLATNRKSIPPHRVPAV